MLCCLPLLFITCWSTYAMAIAGEAIYLEQAQVYLASLLTSSSYYDPDADDDWQSILRRSSARWSDPEVGAVFADYFLLEAMVSSPPVCLYPRRLSPGLF